MTRGNTDGLEQIYPFLLYFSYIKASAINLNLRPNFLDGTSHPAESLDDWGKSTERLYFQTNAGNKVGC